MVNFMNIRGLTINIMEWLIIIYVLIMVIYVNILFILTMGVIV